MDRLTVFTISGDYCIGTKVNRTIKLFKNRTVQMLYNYIIIYDAWYIFNA